MSSGIIRKEGRPLIKINNSNYTPVAYMTYNPDKQRFAEFDEIGIKFASFTIHIGDQGINEESGVHPFSKHIYIDDNNYDFSDVDKTLAMIDGEDNQMLVFPRVYIDAPKWWQDENPDELCCNFRGDTLKQSFASAKWRADMWNVFRDLINYINASAWKNKIVGYHVAFGGTEECVYQALPGDSVDYSEVNRQSFCNWLSKKYESVAKINETWNSNYLAFEEISIPRWVERVYCRNGVLRDLEQEMHVIDYYEYSSNLLAENIIYFCKKIKEYTDYSLITGAFYGYIWSIPNQDKGTHDLMTLLQSPYIDFIASTNGGAGPKGSWPFGSAVNSVALHGKLWFAEGDVRTYKSTLLKDALPNVDPGNGWYEGPVWMGPPNMELSISTLKKAAARVLTGGSGIWWFDMFGNWFRTPEMMQVIANSLKWMNDQTSGPLKSEIAVFLDEKGYKYFGLKNPVLYELINKQKNELAWIGAPYDIYLADDITNPDLSLEEYKLCIFLTSVYPKQETKQAIEEKLKKDKRTLLWVYLQDINQGSSSTTDFDVTYSKECTEGQGVFDELTFPAQPVQHAEFSEVDKKQSFCIAYLNNTNEPCVLWKEKDDYASVYSLLPALPAKLVSHIAALSGVHLYNRTGEVIFAGGHYVGIHATTAGFKRIYFPVAAKGIYDAETGEKMKLNYNFIDFHMDEFETRVFSLLL